MKYFEGVSYRGVYGVIGCSIFQGFGSLFATGRIDSIVYNVLFGVTGSVLAVVGYNVVIGFDWKRVFSRSNIWSFVKLVFLITLCSTTLLYFGIVVYQYSVWIWPLIFHGWIDVNFWDVLKKGIVFPLLYLAGICSAIVLVAITIEYFLIFFLRPNYNPTIIDESELEEYSTRIFFYLLFASLFCTIGFNLIEKYSKNLIEGQKAKYETEIREYNNKNQLRIYTLDSVKSIIQDSISSEPSYGKFSIKKKWVESNWKMFADSSQKNFIHKYSNWGRYAEFPPDRTILDLVENSFVSTLTDVNYYTRFCLTNILILLYLTYLYLRGKIVI